MTSDARRVPPRCDSGDAAITDLYEEVLRLKAAGRGVALATIFRTEGSTPRETGAKMLVRDDGTTLGTIGGGSLEAQVIANCVTAMQEEKASIFHHDLTGKDTDRTGMICGGVLDIYIEPILYPPEVFIFGGGHISLFVSKTCAMAGFRVAVIDDRPEFANVDRFPEAGQVIAEPFATAFTSLKVAPSDFLVIVTRGHAFDQEVLEWALTTEARYIGMIGSKRKIQAIYRNLETKGVSAEQLARVHAPIGLEIGALSPEEIAVAIVAELIQVRRESSLEENRSARPCAG